MYKIDPCGEPIADAFRSIALSQVDEALGELGAADSSGRSVVHEARRRCKKLRGLLRLVRPGFAGFALENRALRDAAALLSHLRDAEVMRQTLDALSRQRPADAEPLARIAARLAAEPEAEARGDQLGEFRLALVAIRDRVPAWTLREAGAEAVLPGLRRTYRDDRRGMRLSRRTGLDRDFHEWRKANKNHGFHVDLLKKLAPDLLVDDLRTIEQLSDLLGQHHDLSVLGSTANDAPERFGEVADLAVLHAAIAARTGELEAAALALGRQILAERPRGLAHRFARYWSSAT